MKQTIIIKPYDPNLPKYFQKEKMKTDYIKEILKKVKL